MICDSPVSCFSLRFLRLMAGGMCLLASACAAQTPATKTDPPPSADAAKTPPRTEDPEIRLGRMAAEDNDKHIKLVTDSAILERVNRIGQELAAAANKYPVPALYGDPTIKQFNYTFKVVDEKDVNAYSIPGGYIYINKGLIDYVHSDDELAGVLAHEISHAAHHHIVKLLREQRKLSNFLTPIQLAAIGMILAGRGGSGTQAGVGALQAGQLYGAAKLAGYSVEAEEDADHSGLLLMTHTRYNPAGLYTFMLRLNSYEKAHMTFDPGYLRDHPASPERVASAKAVLDKLHLPIYLSEVDPAWRAVVRPTSVSGIDMAEIKIRDITLCRVVGADGMTAVQRGERLGKRLTSLVDRQLQPFEIRVNHDQTGILVRSSLMLTAADATSQNKTLEVLAHEMADAVIELNQRQQLEMAVSSVP